jgi:hypothetical protein
VMFDTFCSAVIIITCSFSWLGSTKAFCVCKLFDTCFLLYSLIYFVNNVGSVVGNFVHGVLKIKNVRNWP